MDIIKNESKVYQNTVTRMKAKGMKQLSVLTIKSFLIERFEFWADKHGITFILEVRKDGSVTSYKETRV